MQFAVECKISQFYLRMKIRYFEKFTDIDLYTIDKLLRQKAMKIDRFTFT